MIDRSIIKCCYGLERETFRIDRHGRLASTSHPFNSNSITRDFSENQLEIVTPVCDSIDDLMKSLERLDKTVRDKLAENGESLWLYSNPPHFENESEIIIADFKGPLYEKKLYREKIAPKYGKRFYLPLGVHFNFSFDDNYLISIYHGNDLITFKQEYYLKLYKQLYVHSWLLLLLTAASPFYDLSLIDDGKTGIVKSKYSSIRNSEKGIWNKFIPILNYDNYDDFIQSLRYYIDNGSLISLSELYLPVRLKPKDNYSVESFEKGISHLELRMFDINPFESQGISKTDLEFTQLLIIYLSTQEDFDLTPKLQKKAIEDHKNAALYDLSGIKVDGEDILEKADAIIRNMTLMFKGDAEATKVLRYEQNKLNDRLCTRLDEFFFRN